MPFTPDSPSDLDTAQLARYRNQFPDKATTPEDFLGKLARAEAAGFYALQQRLRRVSLDAIPQQGSTYAALSSWATAVGLADGEGGYGPKKATAATGLQAAATGTVGSVVWDGLGDPPILTGPDGVTLFELTAAATIGVTGSVTISLNATTTGTAGNLSADDVVTFQAPPANVQATAIITTGATNGTDAESLDSLYARLLFRWRNPPKGGTSSDWIAWGLAQTGIDAAYLYSRRQGTGTVDLVLTQAGTGAGDSRRPSAAVISTARDNIALLRSVTVEGMTIARPYMPALTAGCTIVIRVIPTTGNEFDWDSSTGGPWAIDTIVDATHYKLDTLAPTDLKTAITNGSQPRIQFVTAASALPIEARCTAYADAGGKTTLTLAAAPSVPGIAGDPVYAGGNAVAPVAAAALALVGSLGPSRLSGFADAQQDEWDDTLRVDRLIAVAIDALDDSGARVVRDLVTDPTINGSATNFQAADDGVNPPQLLYVVSVAVTP